MRVSDRSASILSLSLRALLLMMLLPAASFAAQRYVANGGVDAPNNCLSSAAPCQTLTYAVSVSVASDVINVAAGTYAGNPVIDKSLTLLGPNAGIDPNTGARGAEAILVPAAVETSIQGSTSGVILRVGGASHIDVTIDGFTMDGHNTSLSGGRVLNGVEIHTGAAIANSIGSFDTNPGGSDATMIVQNNIIQNLERYGVLVDGVPSVVSLGGSNVRHNKIDNLPSGNNFGGGRGRAIAFEENHYGSATFNVITRVNVGIQDDDYNQASPVTPMIWTDNTIQTYHRGIFHNLQYQNASNATIANNHISAETSGDFPASSTNFGIEISSLQNAVGVTLSNNDVTGMVHGILLWNLPTTGAVSISGGRLMNNQSGILFTDNDPQFGLAFAGTATVRRVTVIGSTVSAFRLEGNSGLTINTSYSRLVGNAAGVITSGSGPFTAIFETNWWGCNAGPAIPPVMSPGCDSIVTGVDADPWMVLGINAAPTTIPYGGTSSITQDLTHDSNGADTAPGGFLPDGIPVSFAATGGTMAPSSSTTTSGQSTSLFTATAVGAGSASTTVDSQTVTAPITVTQAATMTTLVAMPSASTFGQSVTFTATVSAAVPGATGSVQFMEGLVLLATVPLTGSTATFNTSMLAAGSHSITAVYGGDVNFVGSTSNLVILVVSQATTTTTLVAMPNPSTFGQSVTFTATVSAAAPGATGSVQFMEGLVVLGTVPLTGTTAMFNISNLAVGSHDITAVYGGDMNFVGSTSNPVTQVVNPQLVSVAIPALGPLGLLLLGLALAVIGALVLRK